MGRPHQATPSGSPKTSLGNRAVWVGLYPFQRLGGLKKTLMAGTGPQDNAGGTQRSGTFI